MTSLEMPTPCFCLSEFIGTTLNFINYHFHLGRRNRKGNQYVDGGYRFLDFVINKACSRMVIKSRLRCKLIQVDSLWSIGDGGSQQYQMRDF